MTRRLLAMAAVVGLLCVPVGAHNRGVVHPEITHVAMELLREHDMITNGGMSAPVTLTDDCPDCAFNEIWEHRGMLDPPAGPRATVAIDDANNYINDYNNQNAASIMIGVIIEDGWGGISSLTPFNHFYHARSGTGLSTGPGGYNSSRVRTETIFSFGIEVMGYTDQSVQRASLYLGRLLHHVEDMTSPAHVHNDAHPPGNEHDDYEGRYVPEELWRNSLLRPQLQTATTPAAVAGADQIWPVPVAQHTEPPDASLAGFIYNRTTMWSTLQYPTNGVPPPAATGELAEMFPGDAGDPADDGLHWFSPMIGFDRWRISGVGEYHYRASWADEDEWWPDTAADEAGAGNPGGIEAAYYIENLMTGDDLATAVVPDGHRANFNARWHAMTNPVVQNTFCDLGTNDGNPCSKQADCPGGTCRGTAIVQRQGQFLLDEPVEFVAGAAMWWNRFANMPPYLKKVTTTQNMLNKYTAEWLDEDPVQMIDHTIAEIGPVGNTTETIETITLRNFSHNPILREHVNALADLELVLEFNEPIKEMTELDLLDGGGTSLLDIHALIPMPVKSNEDMTWTYTIPAASLMMLNGELTLKVKALDKNEHIQEGGDLDGTPQSPARRNLDGPISISDPLIGIPWHDSMSNPDQAYDHMLGDRNHRLLFDTTDPETSISVTP